MAYLHSRQPAPGILHGDLKASNLLLDDDGRRVVIADFGLAGWLHARGSHAAEQMGALTTTIAPPEVGAPSPRSFIAPLPQTRAIPVQEVENGAFVLGVHHSCHLHIYLLLLPRQRALI
jgi:serine/threonine protein kinase